MKKQNRSNNVLLNRSTLILLFISLCFASSVSAGKIMYGELESMYLNPSDSITYDKLVLKYGDIPNKLNVFEIDCTGDTIHLSDDLRHSGFSRIIDGQNYKSFLRQIVVDSTINEYRPKSLANLFANFGSIEAIYGLEYLNTDSVTDMSKMFYGCSHLSYFNSSHYDVEETRAWESMFFDLSTFNTSNVTRMDSMFAYAFEPINFRTCYCEPNFPILKLKSFDTRNVTNMSGMFAECNGRIYGDLDNFNTGNVTDMSGMFKNYYNDKYSWYLREELAYRPTEPDESSFEMRSYKFDLRNFDTRKVTNMSEMFKDCSGITSIIVGEYWSTESLSKEEGSNNIFEGCLFLKGGLGTIYSEEHVDGAYAHIDGGEANPGYLTGISQLESVPLHKVDQAIIWSYNGQLFIKSETISSYHIYDVFGRIVYQGTTSQEETSIALPRQSIYIVDINGAKRKIILD